MKTLTEMRKMPRRPPKKGPVTAVDVEPVYVRIGKLCRELRERRAWSQMELATRMLWTRASICNIEHGKQRVLLHDVVRMAQVLGVRVEDFFAEIGL